MRIVIDINTENAIFDENVYGYGAKIGEVRNILNRVTVKVYEGFTSGPVMSGGHNVGAWGIEEEPTMATQCDNMPCEHNHPPFCTHPTLSIASDGECIHWHNQPDPDSLEALHESCTRCGERKKGVQERFSYGIYAGRLCGKCCLSFRDHCGLDQDQGHAYDLDEQIDEDF